MVERDYDHLYTSHSRPLNLWVLSLGQHVLTVPQFLCLPLRIGVLTPYTYKCVCNVRLSLPYMFICSYVDIKEVRTLTRAIKTHAYFKGK